ncbi:MAG: N-acetylmuramic acid 6-phosphate etherase [Fusobacteriaceae bacterium]
MSIDLKSLVTETRNENSMNIDTLSTMEMAKIMNDEDKKVAQAIEKELPTIVQAIDTIAKAFLDGGRLIYIGAGTSGRLGILDASECPPTYGTDPNMVVGLIAGGEYAIRNAVEGAEDSRELGIEDLKSLRFSSKDVLVGIAASGRTPYVLGAMDYAKSLGATVVGLSCNPESPIAENAHIAISPVPGPEVVTGSTRLKAGTTQKLVLNMLTTLSMIKIGKVYGNLMVDVQATNEKLVERQKKIVMEATGVSKEEATSALEKCSNNCKSAIFMILSGLSAEEAMKKLGEHRGFIREAEKSIKK